MVRVLPVHNFLEQNVAQTEEPTASCMASCFSSEFTEKPNVEYLLLGLPSHCVEVRDLSSSELPFVTAFPTVDLVSHLLYCAKGNYVATLETKLGRDNSTSSAVRIYVNWLTQERQPMRARIAGRVTPSLNRSQNSLEMIELPLNAKPTTIACCQTTGNLLVALGNALVLHEFKIETQNLSKLKFIDFEARPWSIGLHFVPTNLRIVEDFFAVMDSTRFVVFRLTNPLYDDIDHLNSLTSTTTTTSSSTNNDKTTASSDYCSLETVDNNSTKIIKNDVANVIKQKNINNRENSIDKNSNLRNFFNFTLKKNKKMNYVDWNKLINNEKTELESLVNDGFVDENSKPFSMHLPSISLERAGPGHTLNPFVLNSDDTEVYIKTTSPNNGWSENYVVKSILRLKIVGFNGFTKNVKNTEYFTSFVLKPLYMKTNNNFKGLKKSMLRSEKYKYFDGVTCLICTTQEGYVYHFNTDDNDDNNPTCLTTYPFTAPVTHVSLEYTCLHAFTEAGLESYTLRLPHHIAKTTSQMKNLKTIYPDICEPVCLIGLRSFIGVQRLMSSDRYLVLLSKAENSWTIYSLRLPGTENIYYDIVNAAKSHRTTSPSTYRHLLEEAHAMLRLAKDLIDTYQTQNDSKIEHLYNQSCALLGDYFIKTDVELERHLCIPYYKLSGLKPSQVLGRKSTQNAPGLVNYLIDVLINIKPGPEADALFQYQNIVDIISSESQEDLLKIILGSVVIREYATDKLIKLLAPKNEDDCCNLALALLYLQSEKQTLAKTSMDKVSDQFFLRTVLGYPHLLFDEGAFDSDNQDNLSFSDFSAMMICRKSWIFGQILTRLIDNGLVKLHQIMQVFLEYLPSRVGRDGLDAAAALQQFLEMYLYSYFSKLQDKDEICHDFAVTEALKILVRSYLGKLMQSKIYKSNKSSINEEKKDGDSYLFESQRPKYLDNMPPCARNYHKILNSEDLDEFSNTSNEENERNVRTEYLKLQALLSNDRLPIECLNEVEKFLDAETIDGSLALRTLCNRDTKAITQMLIDECPQAVLSYAKEKYTKEIEWKFLMDLLQGKISQTNLSQESRLFYEHTIIETLKHAAEVLPLKSLYYLFPENDDKTFQHYTEICDQIVHAEHVKTLLKKTGHQLLSTLNL